MAAQAGDLAETCALFLVAIASKADCVESDSSPGLVLSLRCDSISDSASKIDELFAGQGGSTGR